MRVRFEPSGREIYVPAGERLLDALDEQPAEEVAFACRGAHCGTCRVRVVEGADRVAPALARELETLAELGAEDGERLACQVVLREGASARVVLLVSSRA